jgi:putative flippase GtrA
MPTSTVRNKVATLLAQQSVRYLINGLAATAVHFAVLTFNLKVLGWDSAGIANLVAAVFGIAASFLGSRYFVFQDSAESLFKQVYRFIFLYTAIALLHGALMYVWADHYHLNYIAGFVVATVMQVLCSYWANKRMVFKV